MDKCVQIWTRNYGALGQTARVCFGVLCANRTRGVKRDFCDLPMRRNEGRVVNTHLVFKRGSFSGERKKKGQESPGERTDGRRRRVDGKDKRRKSGRENGRKERRRRDRRERTDERKRESGRENGRKEKEGRRKRRERREEKTGEKEKEKG
ncbi:hypothetical protein TNCV_3127751 [Trichonephila clavipes]|nr:hypothetical protein TNCV_3127751 [Trichonephila clavipes]